MSETSGRPRSQLTDVAILLRIGLRHRYGAGSGFLTLRRSRIQELKQRNRVVL